VVLTGLQLPAVGIVHEASSATTGASCHRSLSRATTRPALRATRWKQRVATGRWRRRRQWRPLSPLDYQGGRLHTGNGVCAVRLTSPRRSGLAFYLWGSSLRRFPVNPVHWRTNSLQLSYSAAAQEDTVLKSFIAGGRRTEHNPILLSSTTPRTSSSLSLVARQLVSLLPPTARLPAGRGPISATTSW